MDTNRCSAKCLPCQQHRFSNGCAYRLTKAYCQCSSVTVADHIIHAVVLTIQSPLSTTYSFSYAVSLSICTANGIFSTTVRGAFRISFSISKWRAI